MRTAGLFATCSNSCLTLDNRRSRSPKLSQILFPRAFVAVSTELSLTLKETRTVVTSANSVKEMANVVDKIDRGYLL
jgi:hypothetical protein